MNTRHQRRALIAAGALILGTVVNTTVCFWLAHDGVFDWIFAICLVTYQAAPVAYTLPTLIRVAHADLAPVPVEVSTRSRDSA